MDGEGARLYGGRWNSEGIPVVYTSSTLSLAALELLVHIDPDELPGDLVALRLESPHPPSQRSIAVEDLPRGWNRRPNHPACRAAGDAWASRAETALLSVPSAVIPEEENVLLNPNHPEAIRFRVEAKRPFELDARLLR